MRLSEAIRIGASWSKQVRINLKTVHGTCALGAAIEGTWGEVFWNRNGVGKAGKCYDILELQYPILNEHVDNVTSNDFSDALLITEIVCLNDTYFWTRDEIADWVEMKEYELGYYEDTEPANVKHDFIKMK